jgi:hypothetical protein
MMDYGDEGGHVHHVGDGIWPRGDGEDLAGEGDFPMQDLRGRRKVRAAPEFVNVEDNTFREFICEAEQRLLRFHRINGFGILLARRHGADSLTGNLGGALEGAATGAESRQREAY